MLRGIDPILGPDLLHALRAMGHGDEIAIVDANYPAESNATRLVRIDAADAVRVADAILSVMPLDTFVDCAAFRMAVVDDAEKGAAGLQGIREGGGAARAGLQGRGARALRLL